MSFSGDVVRASRSKKKRERRIRNEKKAKEEEKELKKRKRNESAAVQAQVEAMDDEARRERKKQKKKAALKAFKQKKKEAALARQRMYPPSFPPEQLQEWLSEEYKMALARLDEDPAAALPIEPGFFATRKAIHGIAAVVKANLADWRDVLVEQPPSRDPSALKVPLVLVVTVNTDKTLDLVKKVRTLGETTPVFKLFSRHIKPKEQQRLLERDECRIAVGTPNRILRLCEDGAIDLCKRTRLICIDTSRDKKLANVVDSFSTRDDFFRLLHHFFLNAVMAREGKCQFCIF